MPYSHHPKTLDMISAHHSPNLTTNQCASYLVQTIDAPLEEVWSILRRFDNPQAYKQFIKSCSICSGNGSQVGSVREVFVVSGLPAGTSIERLDKLDDDLHVMVVSIIGGDHKLVNYQSTTTLHEIEGDTGKMVVIESYVVDVPSDSIKEDTCFFVNTIIQCNLRSLARITEQSKSF